ncbi:uncharacterized protein ASCRUDRAFT_10675 [Ascoidea rubescens DSM 1968]|uniref:Telomere repeat-binding factor dimerisation domain-containing protein n=1 Tax=Ascoidea rubescens DSM 1968 TaxID=1344418 RepID=A0A1D2V8J0_9ASCO|nr:hypothetical protein ASCRUDRAFT_10675 [Ascoidea rubescens DSM 1968]ODV57934.1 hypothetical protein ASCRUDRAFT_10675 [Ascoidea rubescens DSM 1968]
MNSISRSILRLEPAIKDEENIDYNLQKDTSHPNISLFLLLPNPQNIAPPKVVTDLNDTEFSSTELEAPINALDPTVNQNTSSSAVSFQTSLSSTYRYNKIIDKLYEVLPCPQSTQIEIEPLLNNLIHVLKYNLKHQIFRSNNRTWDEFWKPGNVASSILRGEEDIIETALRKSNIATFICCTLGMMDTVSLSDLDENLLNVFCPASNAVTLDTKLSNPLSNQSQDDIIATANTTGVGGSRKSLKSQISMCFFSRYRLEYLIDNPNE